MIGMGMGLKVVGRTLVGLAGGDVGDCRLDAIGLWMRDMSIWGLRDVRVERFFFYTMSFMGRRQSENLRSWEDFG